MPAHHIPCPQMMTISLREEISLVKRGARSDISDMLAVLVKLWSSMCSVVRALVFSCSTAIDTAHILLLIKHPAYGRQNWQWTAMKAYHFLHSLLQKVYIQRAV